MPIFGIIITKVLFALDYKHGPLWVRDDADFYCLLILVIAISSFAFGLIQKTSFGLIGENVTLRIRKQLYSKIL